MYDSSVNNIVPFPACSSSSTFSCLSVRLVCLSCSSVCLPVLSVRPSVCLLTAGVGFVGRHLTSYLVKNQLTSKIRVVDKVPPGMGWLNEDHRVSHPHCIVACDSLNSKNFLGGGPSCIPVCGGIVWLHSLQLVIHTR